MARKRTTSRAKAARESPRRSAGRAAPAIPVWVPPTLFAALTLWLFRSFVVSDAMLFGGDTLSLGYVARAFYAEALKQAGTFPLWNPQILGGTPFVEALSGGDSLYPPSALLLMMLEPHRALGWKLVLHVLAAGFFMFGWTRRLGCSRAAALVAGTGYMLAPFLVSLVRPGHDGKLFVTALAPLVFWAVERHFVRPGRASFAGIGLVVALVLLTTHFQMAYFLFGSVGAYALFRTLQVARGRRLEAAGGAPDPGLVGPTAARRVASPWMVFGLFLAASLTGGAAAAVQFLPAAQYVTEHSRRVQTTRAAAGETGRDWSSSWSLHPEEVMSQLIPEFAGNDAGGSAWTQGTYWGRNGTRDNLPTAGVLLLVLSAVSFAGGARRGLRWFFAAVSVVATLFALGTHTPVWGLFYTLVPGIRLFRAPDMVMFLVAFSAPTLAAFGVDRLLRAAADDDEATWGPPLRVLGWAVAVLGGLAVLAASGLLTSLWTSVVYRDVQPGQLQQLETLRPFLVRGAFVSAALVAAAAGMAWAVARSFLAPAALVVGLVLLVALDQLRVDSSFVQVMDFDEWARPDPNIEALLAREGQGAEPYRLLSFAESGQDVKPALYGIELAAGHHPNDLARYRELIGMVGSGMPENLLNSSIRRLLNVRYILWPDWQLGPAPEAGILSRTQLAEGRPYETLLTDGGLARARLVGAAVVKPDAEAVGYMLSDTFDPEGEVVLTEASPLTLDGGAVTGTVAWEERGINRLRWRVTSDRNALLVVADNWFPAWRATVDDAEAPVLRAYHTLRAVPVPAGEHVVEMVYRSSVLIRGLWISVVALTGLIALGVWGLARERGGGA